MRRLALLLSLSTVALAACSTAEPPVAAPSAASPAASGAPVVRGLDEAHPEAATATVAFGAEMRPGLTLVPAAVTGDGLVAGSLVDADARQHALVLADPKTGKVTATLREQRPASNGLDGPWFDPVAADDRHVAWVEGVADGDFTDWRLFLHDRESGRTEAVAAGRADIDCAVDGSRLFLGEGRLWWTDCDIAKNGRAPAVFSADLADREPGLLRKNAILRGLAGGGETFVEDASADLLPVVLLDATGEPKETVVKTGPDGFAADAELSAREVWGEEEGRLHLRDGARDLVLPHTASGPVSVSGPFAAWAAIDPADTGWLYDGRTGTALRLPGAPGSVVLGGSHVVWTTGQDPAPSAAPGEVVAAFSLPDTVHLLPLSALTP
ncbi:hypothetical protein GCM10022221_70690 [Actinocorallia aurea]